MPETLTPAELANRVGQEVGISDWIDVSQQMIDRFADATLDRQYIHVDPERARSTPFDGTIAHGFLSLSLLSRMSFDALPQIDNTVMGVNYGMNRLRFLAPVKSGERVRGRFVLQEIAEKSLGQLLLTYDVMVEIEGGSKPALVVEWLTMTVLDAAA